MQEIWPSRDPATVIVIPIKGGCLFKQKTRRHMTESWSVLFLPLNPNYLNLEGLPTSLAHATLLAWMSEQPNSLISYNQAK